MRFVEPLHLYFYSRSITYANQGECYRHFKVILTNLPYGKDLHGQPLKSALEDLFAEYYNDIVTEKLSPAANSQRNESFNSTVGLKNPCKVRFYGCSEGI